MSIFSTIIADEHTFAAWAEKELEKLYSEAPKLEQILGTVLAYAGPALQTVVSAEAGSAAGAVVGSVLKQAQSDLTAASGLVYDFGAIPSVSSILGSVQTNLGALLAAGHVTNPKSVATVTKVTGELDALVGAFPTAAATPAAAPPAA